ncbi:EF-hand domain-containing protein [Roseovarius aestuarii]|nr:EF-hand domain-containing protein [Roseovarius aestuarii]
MTKFIAILIGMGALANSAVAQSSMTMAESVVELDANGDGVMTIDEMMAAYPEMTADQFSQLDTNGDGALDDAEMVAGQEQGLIPAPASEG